MADALNQVNPSDGHNEPNPGHNHLDPNPGDGHNEPNQPESNHNPSPNPEAEAEAEAEAAMIKCLNWTPLHVAASRGDSETVRALIQVRRDMCLARDRGGANPLHVAAMRGKVEVLDEFYKANSHAARARIDSAEKETILHLCVKYDQLLFLKKLLEKYFKGKEFVNAKDNAGNTILHLAVADRRLEIIEYVVSHTEIDVNAVNKSNQTVMDILLDGQEKGSKPESEDKYVEALLKTKDAKREFAVLSCPARKAETRNGIMVAAVLMAALAFQVSVNPPGGVWPDNKDGHRSGEAVMASNYPFAYDKFMFWATLCFDASTLTVIFTLADMMVGEGSCLTASLTGMFVTIASLLATFELSTSMVSHAGPDIKISWFASWLGASEWSISLSSSVCLFVLMWHGIALEICKKRIKRRWAVERLKRLSHPNQAVGNSNLELISYG